MERTTSRSYTSTALCVAVATGYSWMFSNDEGLRSSVKVEGTTSGDRPCEVKKMGQENKAPKGYGVQRFGGSLCALDYSRPE